MSDFFSDFWSYYISFIVLGGIGGCLLLLFMTARVPVEKSGDKTTGHVYDEDIVELNNPMPRWWMYLFIITSVFGFSYLALYPGLGTNEGMLGWTSLKQYEEEVEANKQKIAPIYAKYAAMPVEEVAKDESAMAIGERLFMNNCSMCHGSDAHGSKGFPNLTDNDWLHGGKPENIIQTITNGRNGMMPPMLAAIGGTTEDARNVANYVLSLSGAKHDEAAAAIGKTKFAACAACHGQNGEGNQMIGAPNLSDDIWLHGFGEAAIMERIKLGKQNQMPAQKERLTKEQIHVLASYVWRFSNMPEAAGMQ